MAEGLLGAPTTGGGCRAPTDLGGSDSKGRGGVGLELLKPTTASTPLRLSNLPYTSLSALSAYSLQSVCLEVRAPPVLNLPRCKALSPVCRHGTATCAANARGPHRISARANCDIGHSRWNPSVLSALCSS
ncbi:hypothetical protein NQZ68_039744 [Dissostichus eleginoides]|nr:hypothetical protein NQZ68_039744 [Dissostichus eleginoides]